MEAYQRGLNRRSVGGNLLKNHGAGGRNRTDMELPPADVEYNTCLNCLTSHGLVFLQKLFYFKHKSIISKLPDVACLLPQLVGRGYNWATIYLPL